MEDSRNFIEKAQSVAEKRSGHKMSPDDMAKEFSKWGAEQRIGYLDSIDSELHASKLSVDEAAKIHVFRRALNAEHRRLRAIDR